MHRPPVRTAILAGGMLLLTACGCSDGRLPTYPVQGRVIFSDGTPLRTGTVECRSPEHAINARGSVERDGSFALGTYTADDGAVAGTQQAIVIQFLANEGLPQIEHDHGHEVDLRFAKYSTSGLTFQVKPEKNFVTLVVEPLAR